MAFKYTEKMRLRHRAYYQANKERIKSAVGARYRKNPKAGLAAKAIYEAKNKTRRRRVRKEWEQKNQEHLKKYHAEWAKRNRHHLTKYHIAWRRKNPELVCNNHTRTKLKRKGFMGSGKLTRGLVERLLVSQNRTCVLCPADLSVIKYHRDHIIPLCKGGKHEDSNIQLLCQHCNQVKGGKLLDFKSRSSQKAATATSYPNLT